MVITSSVFSSILAITERIKIGLFDVSMFMCLLDFGIGMFPYVWNDFVI